MRIGLDVMGGDYAPEQIVLGAIESLDHLTASERLVLIGDQEKIKEILQREGCDPSRFDIVHSTENIEMHEHPAKAFQQKPNSSIAIGFGMLARKKIDGFASAGNTGAMLVGAMYSIKTIPGIFRPAISSELPQQNGKHCIILDVGLNPDCRPDVLYQYGQLGRTYCECMYKIQNPRIALLNLGSEEQKGNLVVKAAHESMKNSPDFNFVGNVEGYDLFDSDKADVVVCDGFVGNVVLKEAEGFYSIIKKRNIHDDFLERFNFENYGGTPILGVNAPVMIGHGVSNARAIKTMILQTRDVIESKLTEKITKIFNNGENGVS